MSLLVSIPFCGKDVRQAQNLVRWIGQLGGVSQHDCVLVADAATPWREARQVHKLAEPSFKTVQSITNPQSVEGWIPGSVSLAWTALSFSKGRAFFFCEPDAVPVKPTWLDDLEAAYVLCGKPFMGSLVHHQKPNWPNPYLEGCAVYPANARDIMEPVWNPNVTWTRACASVVVPQAADTPLIQHVWGEKDNPPTFSDFNVPGTNVYCLKQIRPDAVLWHRCKDGSLIRLLRARMGILPTTSDSHPLMVVLPFCNRDTAMFVKNLEWMRELNDNQLMPFDALLSYDFGTRPGCVQAMKKAAEDVFESVHQTAYDMPKNGQWPPTMAWMHAARHIADKWKRPWLWFEYDMIPLKKGWLETMESAYLDTGLPFMGPVVPERGHVNGTAIYPPNTPQMLPKAMTATGTAWDVAASKEMVPFTFDCSHLMQHVWGLRMGKFHPYIGDPPSFKDEYLMRQLLPSAVLFHRVKDGSLIDRLREKHNKP